MSAYYLALYKGEGDWKDKLVKWWTESRFSHCEIYDSVTGFCYSSSMRDGGVRRKKIKVDQHPNWELVPIDPTDLNFRLFAVYSVNKGYPYDYLGIAFSQFLPLKRHKKHKWFCSEFCAAVMDLDNPHKYSPQDLYKYAVQKQGFS